MWGPQVINTYQIIADVNCSRLYEFFSPGDSSSSAEIMANGENP